MDKLLELLKGLAGDAFDDDAKAKVTAAVEVLNKAASDRASDDLRAQLKKLEAEDKKAKGAIKKLEDAAKDAGGDADARVLELRAKLGDSEASVGQLKADAVTREKRSRMRTALRAAEVPEDKRPAALDLLSLSPAFAQVVLDDAAEEGLAGHKAALEQLKAKHAFLWQKAEAEGDDDAGGAGGGGPPGNGGPGPKPPKGGKGPTHEEIGAGAVAAALQSRGRKVRGVAPATGS